MRCSWILILFFSINGLWCQSTTYIAHGYDLMADGSNTDFRLYMHDNQIGTYADKNTSFLTLVYKLETLHKNKAIKKIILYLSNGNHISEDYVIRVGFQQIKAKNGEVIYQEEFQIDPQANNNDTKVTLKLDSPISINYSKYGYVIFVSFGNSYCEEGEDNTNCPSSDTDNDTNSVPIIYGFKVVYK